MALISANKVEIKSARSMVLIPALGLLIAGVAVTFLAIRGFDLPFWSLIVILLACLILVPFSVMGLISAIVGADVIVDKEKNSATWQQGYLGMGIGTKELVPFEKIAYLEVTIEGDQPDRWRDQTDSLRQFALTLVKRSGKRLTLAQVPVPAYGQADGMDRTLAVGNAIAVLTGTTVRLPEGWELVEIDTSTGDILPEPKVPSAPKPSSHTKGHQKSRLRR